VADREEAAGEVNAILDEARAVPRLVRHPPLDWHIHAVPPEAPLATRIAVETAMAMIDVIRADEHSRLGVCADAECEGLVLDLSRNRSKRFCSVTCGNRNAVAAYRARQARS
jgi:predicted RNA-binding Zn ribbon-like protein